MGEQCPGDGGLWAELGGLGGDVLLAEPADLAGVFEPEAYGDGVFGVGGECCCDVGPVTPPPTAPRSAAQCVDWAGGGEGTRSRPRLG